MIWRVRAHALEQSVTQGVGPCRLLRRFAKKHCDSGDSSVVMMQATQDWQRDDLPLDGALHWHRGLLAEPLVRACAVVVADVLGDDALEVPVIEHDDVVEAFAAPRAEKPCTDRVHVRRAHRRADHPDAGGACERIEGDPELIVAIANQEPWRRTQGGRVAQAIRSNRVTRGLATERCSMASWCRSKAISASNDQRGRKASAKAATSTSTACSIGAQGSANPTGFLADPRSRWDEAADLARACCAKRKKNATAEASHGPHRY
jgi:hypothetical protein